ncbi:filamentous haemagglutinin family protein, partial [Hyphomicrobium sp. 2TAF46]|uniref:filamentous haemagglutinin family protein n=1 Tax=Hyphomicrobium sp. 2TAF46 TaxID=3233019 RepID=UPI003F925CD4
ASGNVDLIAPLGTVDVGEAGVSGFNVNIAALHIVNAANISAQGSTTGVPTIQAPNIGGLTEASNASGAAAQSAANPAQSGASEQPSVIIVEVIGFGGGDDGADDEERKRRTQGQKQGSYNSNSVLQLVGAGELTEAQRSALTTTEARNLPAR